MSEDIFHPEEAFDDLHHLDHAGTVIRRAVMPTSQSATKTKANSIAPIARAVLPWRRKTHCVGSDSSPTGTVDLRQKA
jgi:hypothetical protein